MGKKRILPIAAIFLLSCYDFSFGPRPDSGADSEKDADVIDVDNLNRESQLPIATAYSPTSGGGTATSQQYRLYLNIGVQQPQGVASNGRYQLTIGF
jgi:hypothetical protein